jgi:hypothetical protein
MNHCLIFSSFPLQAKRPGGAHRIATFLRENEWDAEVIDWAAEWPMDALQELTRSRVTSNTKFISFSCFFAHWNDHLETFALWIKTTYPTIPIILGGQSRPRMDSKAVDCYITGYGENAILAVIKSIAGNSLFTPIVYDSRFKDKKVITANHSYPSYPMKSLMIDHEARDFIQPEEWLTVEYSRGCMFKCLYCNFPVLGVKGDYTRDADDYVDQLTRAYDKWGVTKYITADETFNDRTDKIIKFADATEKLSFTPYITAFIRADLLVSRKQDWDHLIRARIIGHYYGVESMNWASAKSIGKGMHPEKLREGLLEVKKYFQEKTGMYRGHISLIAGLPHETKETLQQTIDWCCEHWKGEGAEMWPLEIPIDETMDVPSLLTTKWKEYGYRKRSDTLIKTVGGDQFHEIGNIAHVDQNLDWENDHLDYRQTVKLCKDWSEQLANSQMGLGAFALQEMSYAMTLEETLKLRTGQLYKDKKMWQWAEVSATNLKKVIENYIEKKLNL